MCFKHSLLPAFALILTTMGGWVIGMRGMMVTVQGEDYMMFGEAKGLKDRRLFYRYGVRNAILPQVTGLALSFAFLVSGAVLVELVFQWPGVGTQLYASIRQLDYFMIYGIVLDHHCLHCHCHVHHGHDLSAAGPAHLV